ncbi:Arc family DNA-binding protein [Mesorhizobium sp. A623]
MAKKTLVSKQDQFLVRLPDGMRERIKAKADRADMSMNEAIVWCLEQFFPAPQTFDQKIDELVKKVALLKGDDSSAAIDDLIGGIDATLDQLSKKQLAAPSGFRDAVNERYQQFLDDEMDEMRDLHENPFDDSLYGTPGPQGPTHPDDPFGPYDRTPPEDD